MTQKRRPTHQCRQQADIDQISVLQNSLYDPQRMFFEVTMSEGLVPEKSPYLLDHLVNGRPIRLASPRPELDHEIAIERGGQLSKRCNLESRPPGFVTRKSRRRGVRPPRELGE
jgi:hypothetical protein